jgi:hypothetical protein
MAKTRPPYTPEFRRQMVELVRAGRSPEELAQEFEPTAQAREGYPLQVQCSWSNSPKEAARLTATTFGEVDALFLMRAGISLTVGGCSDRDQFPDNSRGARSTGNRSARPTRKARRQGPLIAAVRCHSRSLRTRRERLRRGRTSSTAKQQRRTLPWPRR